MSSTSFVGRAAAAGGSRPPRAGRGRRGSRSAQSATSGAPPGGDGSGWMPASTDELGGSALAQLVARAPGALSQADRRAGPRRGSRPSRRSPCCPARVARDRPGGRLPSCGYSYQPRRVFRPEPPGGDHARLQWARPPARLSERELGERPGHLEADVDADEVHQLERAHAEAAAEPADAVDLLVARHPLLQESQPLGVERPRAAVDEEARSVGRDDHLLAHRRAGVARDVEGALAGLIRADHLEEPHQRRRVEEVHARPRSRAGPPRRPAR